MVTVRTLFKGHASEEPTAARLAPQPQQQVQLPDPSLACDQHEQWADWIAQQLERTAPLCTVNITSFWNAVDVFSLAGIETCGLQETAVPRDKHSAAKGKACLAGYSAIFSPTDPEAEWQAGVGIATKLPGQTRELRLKTPEGEAAYEVGRLLKGAVRTAREGGCL